METHPDSNSIGSVTRLDRSPPVRIPGLRRRGGAAGLGALPPRLLTLARSHLDRRIRVLQDEEDVVQSMGRSFFRRLRRGDFDLADRDALWALLVTITLNKSRNAADRHLAATARCPPRTTSPAVRRGPVGRPARGVRPGDRRADPAGGRSPERGAGCKAAGPSEPDLRQVALMKLEGYSNREIAER